MRRASRMIGLLGVVLGAVLGCGDHEPGRAQATKMKPTLDAGLLDEPSQEAEPSDAAVADDSPDASTSADAKMEDAGLRDAAAADDLLDAAACPDSGPADAALPDVFAGFPRFVAADTLATGLVRAGEPIAVTCLLLDETQRSYVPGRDVQYVPKVLAEGAATARDDGALVAARAGDIAIACEFPALGIEDASPAIVKVLPGGAARTQAGLDRSAITAGETVAVTCAIDDAWGNAITDRKASLRAYPTDGRNVLGSLLGTFTRAGSYDVYCDVDGAESAAAKLEVRPGLPASLVVARVPDQATYAIGEAIELTRAVSDRFGNPIANVNVPVTSEPAGTAAGDGRFSYSQAGQYRLTATVAQPTEGDVVLAQSVSVLVDSTGPAVACDSPLDGEILTRAPGGNLILRGSVTDPSGVKELRVNGMLSEVDAAGHFTATLATCFGVNFVDLVAIDSGGHHTTRTCAFLLAEHWAPDDTSIDDSLSLRLRQSAIDDSSRDDLDSLADVLHAVLSSSGLRDALHDALLKNRVLKSGCDQTLGGTCVLSSEVDYLDTRIDGPNSTSLTLVDDGMSSRTRIENLRIQVGLDGEIAGAGFQQQGWFIFESITVETVFDVGVSAGRPRVRVRPGSTSSTVGRIGTDFPGVEGQLLDLTVDFFGGMIRDYVALRVEGYVADNLSEVLDGAVAGLDVKSLGRQFDVERLDANAPIPLQCAAQFSSVSTDPIRMLFGMGTRFSTPVAHAKPTLGAPMAATSHLLDVPGTEPLGVAIHGGVFSQGLHALWHGGYFDAALDAKAKSLGLPAGMEVSFVTQLPPVAEILGDRVRVSLGNVMAELSFPNLFDSPIPMTLGARASMAVHLAGDALVFDDFLVDELHLSIDAPDLDLFTRTLLESAIPRLLEYVVGNTLVDALPALPLPSLSLPSTVSSFGLPAGTALGITDPAFAIAAPHVLLRGNSVLSPSR